MLYLVIINSFAGEDYKLFKNKEQAENFLYEKVVYVAGLLEKHGEVEITNTLVNNGKMTIQLIENCCDYKTYTFINKIVQIKKEED